MRESWFSAMRMADNKQRERIAQAQTYRLAKQATQERKMRRTLQVLINEAFASEMPLDDLCERVELTFHKMQSKSAS